jgi:3-dehydroshikimate dehydratase
LAKVVARLTADAGLCVAAYGSYFRVGDPDAGDFEEIVDTAVALGAPTIRVWAGNRGSAESDDAHWAHIVAESRRIADSAGSAGLTVSYEYHRGTLTDTSESAQLLLRRVDHSAIRTYWQPSVDGASEYCAEGLVAVMPYLSNVHVFQWQPGTTRHLLSAGTDIWRKYIEILRGTAGDHFALIEFVKDDLPAHFMLDAATLVNWLKDGAHVNIRSCYTHR